MPDTITIARRFRGPLTSANGGYASGVLAQAVDAGTVEVTLRLPPPLERPLVVAAEADGRMVLLDGDALVAEARPAELDLAPPPPPSLRGGEEAARAEPTGWGSPGFAECFVCGTRPEGDGLEIHARLVPGRDDGLVATTWVAQEHGPRSSGRRSTAPVPTPSSHGARGEPVLARMTGRIERLPEEGERCVVAGWPIERDGRKLHAGTALYGEDGEVLALSRQLWIEPRVETLRRPGLDGSPRSESDEQPAVLVVGGEEVDRDRLADRCPRRELELEAELANTPLADDADRRRGRRARAPRRRRAPSARPPGTPSARRRRGRRRAPAPPGRRR